MTVPEIDQDGHLILYDAALPQGKSKRIFHVNGVASDVAKQRRDIEALVWLTLERPFDVVGIHNSTQGIQADLTESLLGKAELYRFWSQHKTASSQKRLLSYADILRSLCDQALAPDADILTAAKTPAKGLPALDMDLLRRLTSLQALSWDDLETTLYGTYPAGAPRPTMRLAYEIVNAIRTGAEVYVVAHSQGLIITALALHIVQQFFGDYPKWTQALRIIGYGPAIMFEDLPAPARSQAILIQHRQDQVAESFSNLRNVNLWNNLQNQARNLIERADSLIQIIGADSHHSASVYLGLTGDPVGDRSAKLIQQLLLSDWEHDPVVQSLRSTRIILETV
jgi:hypothetical protein